MKYILGAYSQLPYGSSTEEYEQLLSTNISPLLTLVYRNPQYKLLLRIGLNVFEYLEDKHPEINMLVSDLCRKNQLELLTSSCFDTVFSLVPGPERTPSIEKTTTFLRKRFQKKSTGLWYYNQIFNPSFISVMGVCDLNYIIISSYNQLLNSVLYTKPFFMEEMGKSTIIFPTDDKVSKLILDAVKNKDSSDKLISDTKKLLSNNGNSMNVEMINLDQLAFFDCTEQFFNSVFTILGDNCTLPSVYLKDYEISKSFYLPAGFYGRDFNPGKASSVNQIVLESPMLNRHYSLINIIRDASKDLKKNSDEKKHIDSLLLKSASGTLCIPENEYNLSVRSAINKYICEMESVMEAMQLLPENAVIDSDRTPQKLMTSKNLICYLNTKGSVISRLNITSVLYDIAFNNGGGLFEDIFRNTKTGKATDLSGKRYELTALDRKKQDFFAKCSTIELEKVKVNITKRFKLRQNALIADIGIENTSNTPLKDYTYECNLNISLPEHGSSFLCNSKPIIENPTTGNTALMNDKKSPFSMHIFTSEEVLFSIRDLTHSTETIKGNSELYQYSQLKIQKEMVINPLEEKHFTITIKFDKNTRR